MLLRTLQQATHVCTANWICTVQHDQPKMTERCRPIHCIVDKLPHAMLPTRKLGTTLITAKVMIERNDFWLVVPEQCAELRGVTRHQPVARRWCALVIEENFVSDMSTLQRPGGPDQRLGSDIAPHSAINRLPGMITSTDLISASLGECDSNIIIFFPYREFIDMIFNVYEFTAH